MEHLFDNYEAIIYCFKSENESDYLLTNTFNLIESTNNWFILKSTNNECVCLLSKDVILEIIPHKYNYDKINIYKKSNNEKIFSFFGKKLLSATN